jgi:hypothetical protein
MASALAPGVKTPEQIWAEGCCRALLHNYATLTLTAPERSRMTRNYVQAALAIYLSRLVDR